MQHTCPTCGALRVDDGPVDYGRLVQWFFLLEYVKRDRAGGDRLGHACQLLAELERTSQKRTLFVLEMLAEAMGTDLEPWTPEQLELLGSNPFSRSAA